MLPVLGALVLQAAYGAVDLLVVGQFGSTAGLSAVSTGSQVLNLVTFVVTQLAMGVTVLIARYLGEKKPEQIGAVLGGAAVVFTILSIALFLLLVCFAKPIAVLMQAPEEAVSLTTGYIRICGCGIFFIVAYNLMAAIFRGLGDSKSPLLFVLVACIVNIVGDLFLVAGLHLDAAGAALAALRIAVQAGINYLGEDIHLVLIGREEFLVFAVYLNTEDEQISFIVINCCRVYHYGVLLVLIVEVINYLKLYLVAFFVVEYHYILIQIFHIKNLL